MQKKNLKDFGIFTFRVYPERGIKRRARMSNLAKLSYYDVFVFPDSESMYAYYRGMDFDKHIPLRFHALTCGWFAYGLHPVTKRYYRLTCIGAILFVDSVDTVGAGIVSHEMLHAALYYANKAKIDITRINHSKQIEERLCYIQGWLVSQFWIKYYRHHDRKGTQFSFSREGKQ